MSKLSASDDATAQAVGPILRAIENQVIVPVSVRSSNMRQVGYWSERNILVIQFTSGLYAYLAVPPETYAKLMAMDSKGTYFANNIKGRFAYIKLPHRTKENVEPINVLAAG